MKLFRRKKNLWQRAFGRAKPRKVARSGLKVAAGAVALTAASAALSSLRQRTED